MARRAGPLLVISAWPVLLNCQCRFITTSRWLCCGCLACGAPRRGPPEGDVFEERVGGADLMREIGVLAEWFVVSKCMSVCLRRKCQPPKEGAFDKRPRTRCERSHAQNRCIEDECRNLVARRCRACKPRFPGRATALTSFLCLVALSAEEAERNRTSP
jgi:hypothetical protein